MAQYLTKPISIPLGKCDVRMRVARALNIRPQQITSFSLHKRSVDARDKNNVHFVCSYVVQTDADVSAAPYLPPIDVLLQAQRLPVRKFSCIVVGAGPAGLFAALYLAKCGFDVTVVERGSHVDRRKRQIERFFNGGDFDENCNVQFGLGGAGTFSDGKLTSGISSPLTYTVFNQLVRSGAPKDILTDALPHVGTDRLQSVVANLHDEIVSFGGKFLFDSTVVGFSTSDGKVTGVRLSGGELLPCDAVLLACGHSARNLFYCLSDVGATLQFKPFAVGLRVEHTRQFINNAQYGALFATHRDLPSASYKLVYNAPTHSCYSFCMCPGGTVIAANSEPNSVVVNGMSNYARNALNSNSALVVNVTQADVAEYGFGSDCFAGVRFQQHLESSAFQMGVNYSAPCQNVTDFINGRLSSHFDVTPSYSRGVVSADLTGLFPPAIVDCIRSALVRFDSTIKGFGSCGVLTAVESRTSSPVRILRGEDFQSNLRGLYPMGEGAGYAGGIVSAAVDGLRVAISLAKQLDS